MRVNLLRDLLTQRATIQYPKGTLDRAGQPKNEWQTRGSYPCRARFSQSPLSRELDTLNLRGAMEEWIVVYLDASTPISESDRISQIVSPSGRVVHSDLDVESVIRRSDADGELSHYEALCKVVR